MNFAIGIFAKTIGLSEAKTRLAATIGKEKAEEFYSLSKLCIEQSVASVCKTIDLDVNPYWVLAEKDWASSMPPIGFDSFWTGDGSLGARLANVSEKLSKSHDAVILMGTDSPQLSSKLIAHAVRSVACNPKACVIGPAMDGGFYLFGSGVPVSRSIWEAVTYSSHTTLSELVNLLEKEGREFVYLDMQQDVDVVEDLAALSLSLSQNEATLHSRQQEMLDWLNNNSSLF